MAYIGNTPAELVTELDNGVVTTAKLADDAVTAAKIIDGTIISDDLNDGIITNAKVSASAAIAASKLAISGGSNITLQSDGTFDLDNTIDITGAYQQNGTDVITSSGGFRVAQGQDLIIGNNASNTGKLRLYLGHTSAYNLMIRGTTSAREVLFEGSSSGAAYFFRFKNEGTGGANVDITDGALQIGGTTVIDSSRAALNLTRVAINNDNSGDYYAGASDLVIGDDNNNDNGITIVTASDKIGRIHFADGTTGADEYAGFIAYKHADDELLMGAGADGGTDLAVGNGYVNATAELQVGGSSSIYGRLKIYTANEFGIRSEKQFLNFTTNASNSGLTYYNDGTDHYFKPFDGETGNISLGKLSAKWNDFYLQGNIYQDHGSFLRGYDADGNGTRLIGINTDDAIYMGDVDGVTTGATRVRGPGAATQIALGGSTITTSGGHLFVNGDNGQHGLYLARYGQTNESAFLNTDDGKLLITMTQDEANYGGVQINLDVTAANSTGTSAGQFSVYNDDAEKVFAIDAKGYGVISSSTSSGAYLSLQNLDTTLEANQTIGAIYFNANDGSEDGSETQAYIKAVAADTSPDTRLEFGVLRNQGGVDDTVGTEMTLYQDGELYVGNHTRIDGDLTLKGGTNQHAALRFNRSDVSTYDFAYIGFNDLTQSNDDFVISAAGNGNAIRLITNGDRISFSTDNNTTAETFVNSNGVEMHAPRFYTRQNNSVSYTSASSTSNYRIYPQHYDTYSGAGVFHFRTSPINTDSTPRFNLRFGGTPQEVAGKIFLSTNQRTNSPSNAQFRHMWQEYAIGFYSEGDSDGSGGRFISQLHTVSSNYVTAYGVDYVSNSHSQYNTNSDPWHDSYGYYYWDLSQWQGHPLVVKIDLWRGANYSWYYWWS